MQLPKMNIGKEKSRMANRGGEIPKITKVAATSKVVRVISVMNSMDIVEIVSVLVGGRAMMSLLNMVSVIIHLINMAGAKAVMKKGTVNRDTSHNSVMVEVMETLILIRNQVLNLANRMEGRVSDQVRVMVRVPVGRVLNQVLDMVRVLEGRV